MYTNLAISGGALKIISVIGCIKYMEETKIIKNIKNIIGTSAGGIMALFIILDFSHKEIIEFLYHNLKDDILCRFNPDECFNLLTSYGLNCGSNIEILIERILIKKLKIKDITFIELAKITGKNLIICVSNLNKQCSEYFNVDTTPNLSIIKAIHASCSIPLLYSPVIIHDMYYVDGGLYNNFPINYFKNKVLKDIIGINIKLQNQGDPTNFMGYVELMLNSLINKANNIDLIDDNEKNIVTIDLENETSWFSFMELKFQFPKEQWSNYINNGYNCIKNKLCTSQTS